MLLDKIEANYITYEYVLDQTMTHLGHHPNRIATKHRITNKTKSFSRLYRKTDQNCLLFDRDY